MRHRQTGRPVTVSTEGNAGPYIAIDHDQLDRVTDALNRHNIGHWVDHNTLQVNKVPPMATVNLGEGADVNMVQGILDSMPDEDKEDQAEQIATLRQTTARAVARVAIELVPSIFGIGISFSDIFPKKREERRQTIEERKTQLVKELTDAGIDPVMFDVLLTSEMDRRMKVHFGIVFLVLTVLFTAGSYAIVILDAVCKWNMSEVAVTALIIETPIQFIGLLYVIARNLFPSSEKGLHQSRNRKTGS